MLHSLQRTNERERERGVKNRTHSIEMYCTWICICTRVHRGSRQKKDSVLLIYICYMHTCLFVYSHRVCMSVRACAYSIYSIQRFAFVCVGLCMHTDIYAYIIPAARSTPRTHLLLYDLAQSSLTHQLVSLFTRRPLASKPDDFSPLYSHPGQCVEQLLFVCLRCPACFKVLCTAYLTKGGN